jgi:hypothetical protein
MLSPGMQVPRGATTKSMQTSHRRFQVDCPIVSEYFNDYEAQLDIGPGAPERSNLSMELALFYFSPNSSVV